MSGLVSRGSNQKFLPRAHSEKYGTFDKSNWKNIENPTNLKRVDPAIREVIVLLNKKRYRTYSSCSGGHHVDLRKKRQRHIEGYIAFSPPSRVAFELYFTLLGRVGEFQLSTTLGILDEDNGLDQTAYSEIRWLLEDRLRPDRKYYEELFSQMRKTVEALPDADETSDRTMLKALLGRKHSLLGMRIVEEQMERFQ